MWTMLRVAAGGMQAQQRVLDVAANNLSNAETTGYKSRRANLADQPPATVTFAVEGDAGGITFEERQVAQGVRLASVRTNLAPGAFQQTGRPLDVGIAGDGLLQVSLPDGRTAFTRDGALRLDGDRRLVAGSGLLVTPAVTVPAGLTDPSIERDGRVLARDVNGQQQLVGQLTLARFANPDGLESIGQNLFVATVASGDPIAGTPGANGLGSLQSGVLEASNVDVGEEIVRVIQAQRAYQVNLRALQTVDEMLQVANNLRRS